MFETIAKIMLWLILWFSVWLIFYLLTDKKMNYVEKYRQTAGFFFLVLILIILIFHNDLYFLIKPKFQIFPFACLFLLFVFNFIAYRYVGLFFPNYKKAFELDSTLYFAKFDHKYLFSKSFEILYQQVMISLLSVWLANSGLSFLAIVFIFSVIFGWGHIPLFFYSAKSVSIFFLIAAIISAFVFPFLILKVEWGIIYSYIFHWIFYILAGFIFLKNTKNLAD